MRGARRSTTQGGLLFLCSIQQSRPTRGRPGHIESYPNPSVTNGKPSRRPAVTAHMPHVPPERPNLHSRSATASERLGFTLVTDGLRMLYVPPTSSRYSLGCPPSQRKFLKTAEGYRASTMVDPRLTNWFSWRDGGQGCTAPSNPQMSAHLRVHTKTDLKKMNRNMSHRFTFESKRTFYFTKISTSFPLVTSCPESAGQSVSLRYLTRPIFRFGTRPSTDRAVRPLPRRYGICPEGRAFVVLISASRYSALYFEWRNHHWSSRHIQKQRLQAIRR
jgi:hypothetical protein